MHASSFPLCFLFSTGLLCKTIFFNRADITYNYLLLAPPELNVLERLSYCDTGLWVAVADIYPVGHHDARCTEQEGALPFKVSPKKDNRSSHFS